MVTIVPTDGTGFTIDFAAVPNEKWGQNRIHLDLTTTSLEDQRETVEALLAARWPPHRHRTGPDEDTS